MERVIFLDRDGTLNEEVNYLHRKEDLRILEGVPEAIHMLREHGYRIVVVTNQAGVARGYYTEAHVESLHAYMNELLEKQSAGIDSFFYCPIIRNMGSGNTRPYAIAVSRLSECLRWRSSIIRWIRPIPG